MFENDEDIDVDDEFLNIVFDNEESRNNQNSTVSEWTFRQTEDSVESTTQSAIRKCEDNVRVQSDRPTYKSFHIRQDNNNLQGGSKSFVTDCYRTIAEHAGVKNNLCLDSPNNGNKENKRKASPPPSRSKRERRFPGPAGLLPDRKSLRGTPLKGNPPEIESPSTSNQEELCSQGRLSGSVLEEGPWQSLLSDLGPHASVLASVPWSLLASNPGAHLTVQEELCSQGRLSGSVLEEGPWQSLLFDLGPHASVLASVPWSLLASNPAAHLTVQEELCSQGRLSGSVLEEGPWQSLLSDLGPHASVLDTVNVASVKRKAAARCFVGRKLPFLAAVLHHLDVSSADPCVILRDSTGEIHGTLHRAVWQQFAAELVVGSVLVVRNVGLLSTGLSSRRHYLNITANNLATVYSANQDKPQKRELHSFTSNDYERTIEQWKSLVVAPRTAGSPASSLFNTSGSSVSSPAHTYNGQTQFNSPINPAVRSSMSQNPNNPNIRPSMSQNPNNPNIRPSTSQNPNNPNIRPSTSQNPNNPNIRPATSQNPNNPNIRHSTPQNAQGCGNSSGLPQYSRADPPLRPMGKNLFPSGSSSINPNPAQRFSSNTISPSAIMPSCSKPNLNVNMNTFNNSFQSQSVQKLNEKFQNGQTVEDSGPSFKFDPVILKNRGNGVVCSPNNFDNQSNPRNEFGKNYRNSIVNSPRIILSQSSQLSVEEQSVVESVFDGIDADSLFDDDF